MNRDGRSAKPYVYSDNKETRSHATMVLKDVYLNILKMLHPIIPFITEDIYSNFSDKMLIGENYATSLGKFNKEEKEVDKIISLIAKIREVRLSLNVAASKKITLCYNKDNLTKQNLNTLLDAKEVLKKKLWMTVPQMSTLTLIRKNISLKRV